ncbi:hypothetical protein HYH03_008883 [Edaphochlamys debaryana]|uniref:Uncharacterized protein n=1 Tax=Edaphochlamys debaryana TaxID=47281 RepID=A0A835XZ77_9CHLO|nr:hypothetical protein HYH03_008883 [Edaphochlamys debaryana]|eukprot:KAG2492978.1 hypothetical protein HYH03_008883 [Edaphochlamys debaryana]
MASTAARKASTATVAGAPSWKDQLHELIAEIKAWKGPISGVQAMGLVLRVAEAVREWEQAPIAEVGGHVRAVRLESIGGDQEAADKRLLEVLRCSKLLRVRLATYTRTVTCLLGRGPEAAADGMYCLPVHSMDQPIYLEEDEATLDSCVHPQTRQPATLPAELSPERLGRRVLGTKGQLRQARAARTPRDLEVLWGPHEDLLLEEWVPEHGCQGCKLTFRYTLAVFWPRSHERTLPCAGGLDPTVRLLEELLGQRPAAAAAVQGAQDPGRARAVVVKPYHRGPVRRSQAPEGPSQGPQRALAGPQRAQKGVQALAYLVLRAALDMAAAGGGSRPTSGAGGEGECVQPIPRLIRLLGAPEGRRLGGREEPATCALLLEAMERVGGIPDAQALAEASAALVDPGYDNSLRRLVRRSAGSDLGSCLHLATSELLAGFLRKRIARALLKRAAGSSGCVQTASVSDVGRLAALVLTGEPPWREHAQAVTAAILKSGLHQAHITCVLEEPAVAQALEARQPRALAFAAAALEAMEDLHTRIPAPAPPVSGVKTTFPDVGARARRAHQERERLIAKLRAWQ